MKWLSIQVRNSLFLSLSLTLFFRSFVRSLDRRRRRRLAFTLALTRSQAARRISLVRRRRRRRRRESTSTSISAFVDTNNMKRMIGRMNKRRMDAEIEKDTFFCGLDRLFTYVLYICWMLSQGIFSLTHSESWFVA